MRNSNALRYKRWKHFFTGSALFILLLLLISFIISGCQTAKIVSANQLKLEQDFCVTPSLENYTQLPPIIENADSLTSNETELGKQLTKQDILVANASGTLTLIKKMIELEKDINHARQGLLLEYTFGIQKNVALVRLEIDAVSAELQCEIFRTRQLSAYLTNLNVKRNSKLTVGAIALGSITTILPVFITGKTPQNIVAISGGVLAAGVGFLTLKTGKYQLKLMTYRNLLENIWHENTPMVIYPPSVWYCLNNKAFGSAQGVSKAQVLRMRWLKYDLNNKLDKNTESLLFGIGGVFNQDNLDTRVNMLSELLAEVNSIHQYLDNLNYKINDIQSRILHTANFH